MACSHLAEATWSVVGFGVALGAEDGGSLAFVHNTATLDLDTDPAAPARGEVLCGEADTHYARLAQLSGTPYFEEGYGPHRTFGPGARFLSSTDGSLEIRAPRNASRSGLLSDDGQVGVLLSSSNDGERAWVNLDLLFKEDSDASLATLAGIYHAYGWKTFLGDFGGPGYVEVLLARVSARVQFSGQPVSVGADVGAALLWQDETWTGLDLVCGPGASCPGVQRGTLAAADPLCLCYRVSSGGAVDVVSLDGVGATPDVGVCAAECEAEAATVQRCLDGDARCPHEVNVGHVSMDGDLLAVHEGDEVAFAAGAKREILVSVREPVSPPTLYGGSWNVRVLGMSLEAAPRIDLRACGGGSRASTGGVMVLDGQGHVAVFEASTAGASWDGVASVLDTPGARGVLGLGVYTATNLGRVTVDILDQGGHRSVFEGTVSTDGRYLIAQLTSPDDASALMIGIRTP